MRIGKVGTVKIDMVNEKIDIMDYEFVEDNKQTATGCITKHILRRAKRILDKGLYSLMKSVER